MHISRLPNLSFMVKVGQLRYIQSKFEPAPYKNPDSMAVDLLPVSQRIGGLLRGHFRLDRLRTQPFYYYLLARTRYYDEIFLDAAARRVDLILNIGSGSDTRAHRFRAEVADSGCTVVEMDQPSAVEAKRKISGSLWPADRVEYLPIDLNAGRWPQFESWLRERSPLTVQVLIEGVSPYVEQASFQAFLQMLAATLGPRASIAYDYKLSGVADAFGISDRTATPFRLPGRRDEVVEFHRSMGFVVDAFELSSSLVERLVPRRPATSFQAFDKDGLIQLSLLGGSPAQPVRRSRECE